MVYFTSATTNKKQVLQIEKGLELLQRVTSVQNIVRTAEGTGSEVIRK